MGQTPSAEPKPSAPENGKSAAADTNVSSKNYYALLGVEREASDVEIKKAYRQKALLLHPDRHVGKDIEATTAHFALVQHAFQILSDPQERAWYDSHMEGVLRGDGDEDGELFGDDEEGRSVLQADDITRLIGTYAKATSNAKLDFSGSATGFYKVLSSLFDRLSGEEDTASAYAGVDPIDFPRFGSSKDTQSQSLKQFYSVWGGFSTRKSFRWKDLYSYADAPDRRTRRLAEKENKRVRDEAIREFNDSVRTLVAFVKKRDPRMTTFANQSTATSEAERARLLQEASKKQAAAARAAYQSRVGIDDADTNASAIPAWARSRDFEEEEISGASEFASDNESQTEPLERDVFECVVCNKSFKSQGQMDAHEKSKKHLKEMKILERQMRKENAALGLEWSYGDIQGTNRKDEAGEDENAGAALADVQEDFGKDDQVAIDYQDTMHIAQEVDERNVSPQEASSPSTPVSTKGDLLEPRDTSDTGLEGEDESEPDADYAPRESVLRKLEAVSLAPETSEMAIPDQGTPPKGGDTLPDLIAAPRSKPGKAKIKKAKKAARAAVDNQEAGKSMTSRCATCQAAFASNNKLFEHLKQYNHAQIPSAPRPRKNQRMQ